MRALFLALKTRNDGDIADMSLKDDNRLLEARISSSARSEAQGTFVRALLFKISRLSETANDQLCGMKPVSELNDRSIRVSVTFQENGGSVPEKEFPERRTASATRKNNATGMVPDSPQRFIVKLVI